jgi:hypothetical protein
MLKLSGLLGAVGLMSLFAGAIGPGLAFLALCAVLFKIATA